MLTGFQIQIRPNGSWHRRQHDDSSRTACGELIPGAFASRDPSLLGQLCRVCFTRHEIDTGEMAKIELEQLEADRSSLFDDADDEPTDPDGDPKV